LPVFTASEGSQTYFIINGQAKVDASTTRSFTSDRLGRGSYDHPLQNADSSFNRQF